MGTRPVCLNCREHVQEEEERRLATPVVNLLLYRKRASSMNLEERNSYRMKNTEAVWATCHDFYTKSEIAARSGWRVVYGWGKVGYDLGDHPYVVIFFREKDGHYEILKYVEGDVTLYFCPTEEIRNAMTDDIAFYYWKWHDREWVEGYESAEQLPEKLRGPYVPTGGRIEPTPYKSDPNSLLQTFDQEE